MLPYRSRKAMLPHISIIGILPYDLITLDKKIVLLKIIIRRYAIYRRRIIFMLI